MTIAKYKLISYEYSVFDRQLDQQQPGVLQRDEHPRLHEEHRLDSVPGDSAEGQDGVPLPGQFLAGPAFLSLGRLAAHAVPAAEHRPQPADTACGHPHPGARAGRQRRARPSRTPGGHGPGQPPVHGRAAADRWARRG